MWRIGFFFHEMGFGLLSIFLPLYLVSIDKAHGLYYVGIITGIALFSAIPASFMWGYLCDKTRHYKRFVLIAFLSISVLLSLFALTTDIALLILIYALMWIFHAAHEPPKNVLISELYSHQDWEKNFAFYEGFTEVGTLIGLMLGFLASFYGFGPANTLFLVAGLNFVAFVLSALFVVDPPMIFERSLVSMEKRVSFASSGIFLASRMMEGRSLNEKLKTENVVAFCCALALFSLATNILFTPLPIFISTNLAMSSAIVFAVFILNSGGGVVGYLFAANRAERSDGGRRVPGIILARCLLTLLLIGALVLAKSTLSVFLTVGVLISMGLLAAVFTVRIESLFMELIPPGKAGLINVLMGIGAAVGAFVGPFIAETMGFSQVFVITGAIFLGAFISFLLFS
jgi:MFS family permease